MNNSSWKLRNLFRSTRDLEVEATILVITLLVWVNESEGELKEQETQEDSIEYVRSQTIIYSKQIVNLQNWTRKFPYKLSSLDTYFWYEYDATQLSG